MRARKTPDNPKHLRTRSFTDLLRSQLKLLSSNLRAFVSDRGSSVVPRVELNGCLLFNTRRISSRVTEKKEKRGNKGKGGQARSGETGWAGYKARVEQMIDGGGTQERKGGKEREKEKVAYQEAFRSSAQGWTLVSTKTLSLIRVRFECPKG